MAGHAEAVDVNASGDSTPQEVLVGTAEAARPRPFKFPVASTALVVLKMQREFLEVGGYGSLLGNDVGVLRQCIPSVSKLLAAVREAGVARGMRVVHVRESHQADLSDVHTSKLRRTCQQSKGITIGDRGLLGRVLIEGEPGNDFIPECKPLPSEMVCATAGKGIFNGTGLHQLLLEAGVTHVVLAGVTTDVGVQLVMRELNDRGFEPCLAADCTASYMPMLKDVSLEMIVAQGGIVGWTAESADLISGLRSATPEPWDPRPDWVPSSVPTLLPLSGTGAASAPSPTPAAAAALMADGGYGAGGGALDGVSGGVATVQDAAPSPFSFPVNRTACLVIDMQRDFVMEGGFGSTLGNDVKRLQAIVPNVAFLQRVCREYGIPVIHTLEAHLPDLSDCPLAKLTRGQLPSGLRIGDKGAMGRILVRHEWGNGIIDENAPLPGEKVIFKPGKGAFCNTDLHEHLLVLGITHLLVAGVTTEVCVQTSLREANDRGFECIMIDDCTESYFPHFKHATLSMVAAQGGILGWTGTSADVLKALQQCCGPSAGASS